MAAEIVAFIAGRVVMIAVADGAIAANIDPRMPGAHDHVTLQGGLAGDVERGAADRLCQGGERHAEPKRKGGNSQKNTADLQCAG